MPRTTRLPSKGVACRPPSDVDYHRRDGSYSIEKIGIFQEVLRDLGLLPITEAEATQMRRDLGFIIGQWRPPEKSTGADSVFKGTVAAKLAAIARDPKHGKDVFAVSAGSGLHSEVDIQTAGFLAKAVARRFGTENIAVGHKRISKYREDTPDLALAAQEALHEVKNIRGKPGRPRLAWYDDFLRFLITVAEKNGIVPTLGYDDGEGRPVGSIYDFASAFERLLPPDMRSTSPSAMKDRLDTSKKRIGWTSSK